MPSSLSLPRGRRPASGLLFLLLGACFGRPEAAEAGSVPPAAPPPESAVAPEPVLVRVEPLRRGPVELHLQANATVESLDVVDVIAERAEPVRQVLVEEGDKVQRGQVLARLRSEVSELLVAEAQVRLEEAEAEVERTQRELDRNLKLLNGPGGIALATEREVEQARAAQIAARTALEAARVALDQAELELERCTISAPITGTVTLREVSVGDTTALGQRLFQITDLDHPRAVFHRPQRELSLLRPGLALTATAEAFPGLVIPGHVERISPRVDPENGTVKVTALLEPEGYVLPVGILVEIDLVLDRREDALLVPKRALLYEGREVVCYVVRDGRALRIPIQPGYEQPDFLEARFAEDTPPERRLLPGDLVVTVGQDRLSDGGPVEIAGEA